MSLQIWMMEDLYIWWRTQGTRNNFRWGVNVVAHEVENFQQLDYSFQMLLIQVQ